MEKVVVGSGSLEKGIFKKKKGGGALAAKEMRRIDADVGDKDAFEGKRARLE